jgi:hypothetical protein
VADLSLDKPMLQDVLQKSFKADSQETDRDVPDRSILGRCTPRASVCSAASLGPVLQSFDLFTAADTESCAVSGPVWVSTDLAAPEARRLEVGKKRLYQLYREENLGLRRKKLPWRHISAAHLNPKRPAG